MCLPIMLFYDYYLNKTVSYLKFFFYGVENLKDFYYSYKRGAGKFDFKLGLRLTTVTFRQPAPVLVYYFCAKKWGESLFYQVFLPVQRWNARNIVGDEGSVSCATTFEEMFWRNGETAVQREPWYNAHVQQWGREGIIRSNLIYNCNILG